MSNILRAKKACDELGIENNFIDENKNILQYIYKNKTYTFVQGCTNNNSELFSAICLDKGFMYDILKDKVHLPKTLQYLDPDANPTWMEFKKHENIKAIVDDIEKTLSYPLIIKKSRGSLGVNVFKCEDRDSVIDAITKVFSDTKHYDYICLAQEYIHIAKEYRVIVYKNQVEFAYYKNSSSIVHDNLSPLHQINSRAILEEDGSILGQIQSFIDTISKTIDISYNGIDIAMDTSGAWRLIELNSHPGFNYFVRDNGDKKVVELYKKIILSSVHTHDH